MNIVCVKWGQKYSSDYVQKLYNMVSRNMNKSFDFYCYTDDNIKLENIQTIPIQSDQKGVWPKLDLLNIFTKGETIYFDLDVVILNSLERLCSVKTRTVSVLYSQWKSDYFYPYTKKHRAPTLYNSSIMKWDDDQGLDVYNHFIKNKDYILLKYSKGIDRYFFNEPVEIDILPTSIAYSYHHGARYIKDEEPKKLRKDYEVCILNHGEKNHQLDDWVKDYWI